MSEPVEHDDWPRPRFEASLLYVAQTGRPIWCVKDAVYNFRRVARGGEWEMRALADSLERQWLREDERAAAMA